MSLSHCPLVFVIVALLHVQIASTDGVPSSSKNVSEAISQVDHLITQFVANSSLPSLSFGLAVKGKMVWSKAYGYADLENSVKAKFSTRYRLASVSKSFTAALIGSLVDRGLLFFEDPLSSHLSPLDFPPKTWNNQPVNITIGQLLSHTAGAYMDGPAEEYFQDVILAHNVTECIRKRSKYPLIFKPGSKFEYSNYGFLLLGAVIESVTKQSYEQVMAHFLAQHGLHSTVLETMTTLVPDRARTYQASNGTSNRGALIPTPLFDELFLAEAEMSDGNLMSNVADLVKYAQLWIDSSKGRSTEFLSKKTAHQMWIPHTVGLKGLEEEIHYYHKTNIQYGYAWFIMNVSANESTPNNRTEPKRNSVWHSGGAFGVSNLLTIYPDEEIVVVALCNKGDVDGLDVITEFAVNTLL